MRQVFPVLARSVIDLQGSFSGDDRMVGAKRFVAQRQFAPLTDMAS
jgi:hypothetical protein